MSHGAARLAVMLLAVTAVQAWGLRVEGIGTGSYQTMDVQITNDGNVELTVVLEGKEVFVPNDPSFQDIIVASTATVRLAPGASERITGCLSYCLNSGKHTPAQGQHFVLYGQNDNLGWICRYGAQHGLSQSEIQGLVWRYTDIHGSRNPAAPHPSGVLGLEGDRVQYGNLAVRPQARASASSVIANGSLPAHQIRHINDGRYGNSHSWVSNTDPSWAEIDLGGVYWVDKVAFGSDNEGRYSDRAATTFSISVATGAEGGLTRVFSQQNGAPVRRRTEFRFPPVQARRVRLDFGVNDSGQVRVDELEIYGRGDPLP